MAMANHITPAPNTIPTPEPKEIIVDGDNITSVYAYTGWTACGTRMGRWEGLVLRTPTRAVRIPRDDVLELLRVHFNGRLLTARRAPRRTAVHYYVKTTAKK
jgi:hypothetical protein